MSELDELAGMLDAAGIEYEEWPKRKWKCRALHWRTEEGYATAFEYPDGRLLLSASGGLHASPGTIAALAMENERE